VTEEDIRSYDRRIEAQDLPAAELEFEKSIPKPERLPAYSRMFVDGLGRPWLLDYRRWDEEEEYSSPLRRWTVLAADGSAVLGRFEHHEDVRFYDAGEGWVLVVEPDELEVEHVRLYPLVEVER